MSICAALFGIGTCTCGAISDCRFCCSGMPLSTLSGCGVIGDGDGPKSGDEFAESDRDESDEDSAVALAAAGE